MTPNLTKDSNACCRLWWLLGAKKRGIMETETRKHPDGYIRAEYGVRPCTTPYWTVTAEINRNVRFTDRGFVACRQLHDEVRKHFPELAHTLRWHLSESGIPMHYLANAKFWHDMANGKRERLGYDPDPRATFVTHCVQLDGENLSALLDMPWEDARAILESRTDALKAAYAADVAGLV